MKCLFQDVDKVFSNITEIYDFSVAFYGLLEAAIEVADEGKPPAIGTCFEEMAEVDFCSVLLLKIHFTVKKSFGLP